MKKQTWLSGMLVLGMIFSAWGKAAPFNPNVLNDTQWSVLVNAVSTGNDADGPWQDKINTMLFLSFNADKSYEVVWNLGYGTETLFTGEWACDAKGKLAATVDSDSLFEWFKRCLIEDWQDADINESSVKALGSFTGTVKQKGAVLTLNLKGTTNVTANYTVTDWVYNSQSNQWNETLVEVDGQDKNAITMSGQYDTSAMAISEKTYHFTNIAVTTKIKKYLESDTMSFDLTLQPDNFYFGEFIMDFSSGPYSSPVTGDYIVKGKNLSLYVSEPTIVEGVKTTSLAYINGILGSNTLSMNDFGSEWGVYAEGQALTLSENSKNGTARLSGTLAFEVDCWYNWQGNEIDDIGTVTLKGTGNLTE